MVARGRAEGVEHKGAWVNFWRLLEIVYREHTYMYVHLDSGGGSTTRYVCQNLQSCTLTSVNVTICKLNLRCFFLMEKNQKFNQPGSRRPKVQIQLSGHSAGDHLAPASVTRTPGLVSPRDLGNRRFWEADCLSFFFLFH